MKETALKNKGIGVIYHPEMVADARSQYSPYPATVATEIKRRLPILTVVPRDSDWADEIPQLCLATPQGTIILLDWLNTISIRIYSTLDDFLDRDDDVLQAETSCLSVADAEDAVSIVDKVLCTMEHLVAVPLEEGVFEVPTVADRAKWARTTQMAYEDVRSVLHEHCQLEGHQTDH